MTLISSLVLYIRMNFICELNVNCMKMLQKRILGPTFGLIQAIIPSLYKCQFDGFSHV